VGEPLKRSVRRLVSRVMATIKKEDLTGPLFAISDDLERAEKDLISTDDSYSRRNYIRVLFAAIDLGIYLLKRTILVAASSGSDPLTFAELVVLREQVFSVDETGHARTRDKFLRLSLIICGLRSGA
jgi:hypothetical protein